MPRRYRERARLRPTAEILRRPGCLLWWIKKDLGVRVAEDNERAAQANRDKEFARLRRTVYQSGQWWLLDDPYEQEQAKAYFSRGWSNH